MYQTLISQLYRRDAEDSNASTIRYAVDSNNCLTLCKELSRLGGRDFTGYAELPDMVYFLNSSFLYNVIFKGNLVAAKVLLDGVDPNSRNRSEHMSLDDASGQGRIAVVKRLLAHPKIGTGVCDHIHMTALHHAVRGDHTEIVRLLLSCGAHAGPICKIGGITSLHSCIWNQQPEIARLLVNRKNVDPNALSSQSTPLWLAAHVNRQGQV